MSFGSMHRYDLPEHLAAILFEEFVGGKLVLLVTRTKVTKVVADVVGKLFS